ncbi:MAG: type II/IV secretion system protein [Dehalococcoidia bacterium]|nr:MAG: type II/IV secretion system protein [Dehalococcoidia bacterium]
MAVDPNDLRMRTNPAGGTAKSGIARLNMQYQSPMPQALQLVPEDVARKYNVMPMSLDGNTLRVFVVNPSDILIIENLSIYTKKRIEPMMASAADIKEAIDYNYKTVKESVRATDVAASAVATEDRAHADAGGDISVARQLERLLEEGMKARASDIHIEPDESRVRIRYRIDGILHEVASLPLSLHQVLISRIKILSDMNIADHRRPQDGQFSFETANARIDIRVATINTVNGEMAVLRLLNKDLAALALPQIGFVRESQEQFEKMLMMPYGMVLISGPTGAGKTTTLYAAVNSLDSASKNIITIEDPVEYRFENINQIQVNVKAGLTFASGLRSIVRLDPDVILVGEIRDGETAQIAVQSALTGHLVLSSVHANDTVGVLYRLIDLEVEPFLIGSALIGIIAQRMVRRVCPHCARKITVPLVEQMAYEREMGESKTEFMYGAGCQECVYSGYLGRTAIFEILTVTDELRRMIVAGASNTDIRATALSQGLVTIAKDGMMKAKNGITTPYEVLRNAYTI